MVLVTGCATTTSSDSVSSLPPLKKYDEEYRHKFADELEEICPKNDVQLYVNTCDFIQDSLELRARIKAIQ